MRRCLKNSNEQSIQLFGILTRHKVRRTGSKPLKEEEILQRIAYRVQLRNEIQLVYFWGGAKESHQKVADFAEVQALNLIDETVELINAQGILCEVVLIFCDIHACKINGIPENEVEIYFNSINKLLGNRKNHYSLVKLSRIYNKHLAELFDRTTVNLAQQRIKKLQQENCDFVNFIKSISQRHSKLPLSPDKIARKYLLRRMLEDHIIDKEYPHAIFVSYTNPEIIKHISLLPTIFSYSLKRGVSACPWFIESNHSSAGE